MNVKRPGTGGIGLESLAPASTLPMVDIGNVRVNDAQR